MPACFTSTLSVMNMPTVRVYQHFIDLRVTKLNYDLNFINGTKIIKNISLCTVSIWIRQNVRHSFIIPDITPESTLIKHWPFKLLSIYPAPPHKKDTTQGQALKRCITDLNSHTQLKEPDPSYHLPIAGWTIIGFIPLLNVLRYLER